MKTIKLSTLLAMVLLVFSNCTHKSELTEPQNAPLSADNTVFEKVDQMPGFNGGMESFMYYLQNNLKYPEQARTQGVEGKVMVEFVVNKNGSVSDVKVLKGIGAGCDAEAIRVIENSPNWNPGIKDGYSVNVKLVVPISFKLS